MPQNNFESAKLGYEMYIQLWIYEGNSVWAKFNAMLVANGIVFAAFTQIESKLTLVLLGILGVLLCIGWYTITIRGFKAIDYWIFSARELEEQYLSSSLTGVKRGSDFFGGKQVVFNFGKRPKKLKMPGYSNWINNRNSSFFIISLFAISYIIFITYNFFGMYCKLMSCFSND